MKYAQTAVPLHVGAGAAYECSEDLIKQYTTISRFGDEVQLYHKKGNLIYLPRQCCPLGGEDRRVEGIPANYAINFTPKSAEQDRVINESVDLLQQDVNHIVEAPTGFGKTVIGAVVAARMGVKTLIILPKEDLIKEWRNSFRDFAGIPEKRIGLIQGDKCKVAGCDVVIAMVHSVCKHGRYPSWIYQEFGFIIWDEVHTMGADTFSQSAWMFPGKLRLGLSATPYRKDGKEVIFHKHIGTVDVSTDALQLKPRVIMQETGFKLPRVWKKITNQATQTVTKKLVPLPHSAGKTMHINKLLAKCPQRNAMLANFIKAAYDKGRTTLILSDLKDAHLDRIFAALRKRGVPEKDIAYYVGGLSEDERDDAASHPIVLGTFQMVNMGTNYPWWDTMVLATPRSDAKQAIGRILREYDGKVCATKDDGHGIVPVVFDPVDSDSSVFSGYRDKRRTMYRQIGAEVIRK